MKIGAKKFRVQYQLGGHMEKTAASKEAA